MMIIHRWDIRWSKWAKLRLRVLLFWRSTIIPSSLSATLTLFDSLVQILHRSLKTNEFQRFNNKCSTSIFLTEFPNTTMLPFLHVYLMAYEHCTAASSRSFNVFSAPVISVIYAHTFLLRGQELKSLLDVSWLDRAAQTFFSQSGIWTVTGRSTLRATVSNWVSTPDLSLGRTSAVLGHTHCCCFTHSTSKFLINI